MEVRDPVHGSIHILDCEIPILEHRFFQRLRTVKQLGFSEYIFPGATHTRYLHSIGVMNIASKVFDKIFPHLTLNSEGQKLKETLRLACLLHDIGHAPLSHTTESVMPTLGELKLDKRYLEGENLQRQATHEDYTIKTITDSSFCESLKEAQSKFGVSKYQIAELISGNTSEPNYFTIDGVNLFPILHQCVSSEMDCDRMDYLLRDSYFCGVSYGHFDLDWIIDNLELCEIESSGYLGISERAVATFDDFLLSRFHMFLQVYFHYKSVCLEQMLLKYFSETGGEYSIPADIEEYINHDDHMLMKVLRSSENNWARRVIRNAIPTKIFECFGEEHIPTLNNLELYLKAQSIPYLKGSSKNRLSKYYTSTTRDHISSNSLKVTRKIYGGTKKTYTNINEATDLYEKFSDSHEVNRVHCDWSELNQGQQSEVLGIISQ